ncbi:MAG: hypothetical protein KBC95_00120 [Candidatus Peribacteraceae bacterium]|nr:hypothetical protein [Candidatus Peribacteraceae bacterium]
MPHLDSVSAHDDWRSELSRLAEPLRADTARPPLYERLLQQMPPYLRERVNGEVVILRSVFTDPQNHLTGEQMEAALNQRVKAGYKEVATDLVLSHNGTIIQSYQCLRPIIAHELEQELLDPAAKPVIEHTGAVFLDVDGMKTIVDCTNHSNACAYLQRLADILVRPPEALAAWCQEQGLRTEAYSVGGDEFMMKVRSRSPLTDAVLSELEDRLRAVIQGDRALSEDFVRFDDAAFLLDYGFAGEDRRESVLAMGSDGERREALTDIRNQLPSTFVPSVSIGSSRLSPAVERAVEQAADQSADSEEVTFDTVAFNAFQLMVDAADAAAGSHKRVKKQRMKEEDPKLYAFLMRNAEGRGLLNELGAKEQIIARLMWSVDKLRREIDETMAEICLLEDKDQIIARQRIMILQTKTQLQLMSALSAATVQAA